MTQSTKTIHPVLAQLELQGPIFKQALEGVGKKEFYREPAPGLNPIGWLAGHLTAWRSALVQDLGGELEWGPSQEYLPKWNGKSDVSVEEILSAFGVASSALEKRISTMTEKDWLQNAGDKPVPRIAFSNFILYHEGYHLGQIGFARRVLGLPAMKSH